MEAFSTAWMPDLQIKSFLCSESWMTFPYSTIHGLTFVKGIYSFRYFLHQIRIPNLLMHVFVTLLTKCWSKLVGSWSNNRDWCGVNPLCVYASPDLVYALDGSTNTPFGIVSLWILECCSLHCKSSWCIHEADLIYTWTEDGTPYSSAYC